MIVRDEEDVLGRCLDSVRGLVDEIVIADTGSEDSTRAIALRYTDKVYDFTWVDDFSAARNFAFSKASGDYLLWLDADDVIEDPALFREDIACLYAERPEVMAEIDAKIREKVLTKNVEPETDIPASDEEEA